METGYFAKKLELINLICYVLENEEPSETGRASRTYDQV